MLRITGLASGYGKAVIVRDVSLCIEKGEIVAVIGRNGVGKSTLMKTVIGINRPMGGNIEFIGRDITLEKAYQHARLGMGYAPQGNRVFPKLNVEENLRIGQRINEKAPEKKDISVAYEYFPILEKRRKQIAGTLSGGEQAMLCFGRALVGRPLLLLMDELSEGIQPNVVMTIGEIATKTARELGLTILFSEQHMGMIQQIAHRAYAMDKGTIVGELTREELQDYDKVQTYLSV